MEPLTEREQELERVLFEGRRTRRYTTDTPIMPEVWRVYVELDDDARVDLLLTPDRDIDPVRLALVMRDRLEAEYPGAATRARLAYTTAHVAVALTFEELVRVALPLSTWWHERVERGQRPDRGPAGEQDHKWLTEVVKKVQSEPDAHTEKKIAPPDPSKSPKDKPMLWLVTLNRPVETAVTESRRTIKADAAHSVFGLDTKGIHWAVIDSGIDARHPAFRCAKSDGSRYANPFQGARNHTRIIETYDFTLLRTAQTAALTGEEPEDPELRQLWEAHGSALQDLGTDLSNKRPLDWSVLAPLLRVPHRAKQYEEPPNDHGTHVAGILAADWQTDEGPRQGICPELELYDLRVFDRAGRGDEFAVTAALQFVDYLNGYGRKIVVQGANVSLSIPYNFDAFACGQTPVCREANRLAAGGVVVVAAAGNQGVTDYTRGEQTSIGYRSVSLTDPGNAEDVITIGATHRTNPHGYGVSYFSSRGPTGDGRPKPDMVAPGEKIAGPLRDGGWGEMDGTSQAAAHASGAAALLVARDRELIGKPGTVKRVLCKSAIDLERERHFQGAGLLDALRAIEAV